jgi:transcriptional regulator with XRE-family HTH domain
LENRQSVRDKQGFLKGLYDALEAYSPIVNGQYSLIISAMAELNEIVANNLVSLRKDKHLTQQELAEKVGYSDKSISKWELGKAIPTVDILKELADFYGVTVDFLITEGTAEEKVAKTKPNKNRSNQIVITSMAACFVWLTAAAIYANAIIQKSPRSDIIWIAFIWAIPATMFVCGGLIFFFWKRCTAFWVFVSLFVWTLFMAFWLNYYYVDPLHQNLWFIFMAAVPIQVMIILFTQLK